MNLKDLKLSDLIKIALTVTAIVALTFNLSILSNNTTVINNYIQETNKKLDQQDQKLDVTTQKLDVIQKVSNDTQGNVTKVKTDVNKNLAISKEILNQVD
jgi:hypothetical protein